MPNTANRGYPYPGVNEAPDGPYAYQQLADSVDADVEEIDTRLAGMEAALPVAIQAGKGTIAMGAGVPFTNQTVIFPEAFAAPPVVVVNITSSVGGRASLLKIYPTNISAAGFTAKLQTSDNNDVGTSYSIGYNWVAVAV